MSVYRFRAYRWPSGEVCIRLRGVWYGLGLYITGERGVYLSRRGIIAPGFNIIWRRYMPKS